MEVSFNFGPSDAHASETLHAQIVLISKLNAKSEPITLTSLDINLEGSIQSIRLIHKAEIDSVMDSYGFLLEDMKLEELEKVTAAVSTSSFFGTADLKIRPGRNRIFNISFTPHEAGIIKAVTAELSIKMGLFTVSYVNDLQQHLSVADWWLGSSGRPRRRKAIRDPCQITVHPKLPKITIQFSNLRKTYYTGEIIVAEIIIANGEAIAVDVTLDVRIPGQDHLVPELQYLNESDGDGGVLTEQAASAFELKSLKPSAIRKLEVRMLTPSTVSDIVLQVKATYTMELPLTTTSSFEMSISKPFEAQYSISPDLHPEVWPSFFQLEPDVDSTVDTPQSSDSELRNSIVNRWGFHVELHLRATEKLQLKAVQFDLASVSDGAVCYVMQEPYVGKSVIVAPKQIHESIFALDTKRIALEDLRTIIVEGVLNVYWSRPGPDQEETVITSLLTPRLTFPSGEPRVLASSTLR